MRRIARTSMAAVIAVSGSAIAVAGAGGASAETGAGAPAVIPFTQTLRRCDFSKFAYTGGGYYGRPNAFMRIEGGDVVADIQFATGVPNTAYDVRLIQLPRSSARTCNPGDPGVWVATLFTDAAGGGAVTVRGPVDPEATGAWVSMTRPGQFTQKPEEFYTSDFVFDY